MWAKILRNTTDTLLNKAASFQCPNRCLWLYPALRLSLTFLPLLWAAVAVLACRPVLALSVAPVPLQLPGSEKPCSRDSDWWGAGKPIYTYPFLLHTAPLPPAPFSSAVLVGFLQPCPTISLISMVCIKLTSHGVGTGLRRRRLYPLMSNYSSASRTLLWPQATAWGTETSSGSLPSPSRYSLQIHLKGTWHILGLTKL